MNEVLKQFQETYKQKFNTFISIKKITYFLFSFSPKLIFLENYLSMSEIKNLYSLYETYNFRDDISLNEINNEIEKE